MNIERVDEKIEAKLISKIANHRLMVRELFRKRHKDIFDNLIMSQCFYHLNELRVWLRMAQLVDEANRYKDPTLNPYSSAEPYETYYAKQLTE